MNKLSKAMMLLIVPLSMTACAVTKPATLELLQQESAAQLKLYVLDCGTIQSRDLSVFNPNVDKGVKMDMAVPCYVIQHPERGTLVWDAGLGDRYSSEEKGRSIGHNQPKQ
jgi:hypothetical protein